MEFNDGSQYRVVTKPIEQVNERDVYCFRAASARGGSMYVDTAFERHREVLAAMDALLMYQYVYAEYSPEAQAEFLLSTVGGVLRVNEMVMLDIEAGSGIADPVNFTHRWLAVVEPVLRCLAWVYVPSAFSNKLTRQVTGDRIVMAPRYSGGPERGLAPWWPHDVHQYTDRGYFPGCPQTGDVSYTDLTAYQMLARCNPDGVTCECAEGATHDA